MNKVASVLVMNIELDCYLSEDELKCIVYRLRMNRRREPFGIPVCQSPILYSTHCLQHFFLRVLLSFMIFQAHCISIVSQFLHKYLVTYSIKNTTS